MSAWPKFLLVRYQADKSALTVAAFFFKPVHIHQHVCLCPNHLSLLSFYLFGVSARQKFMSGLLVIPISLPRNWQVWMADYKYLWYWYQPGTSTDAILLRITSTSEYCNLLLVCIPLSVHFIVLHRLACWLCIYSCSSMCRMKLLMCFSDVSWTEGRKKWTCLLVSFTALLHRVRHPPNTVVPAEVTIRYVTWQMLEAFSVM